MDKELIYYKDREGAAHIRSIDASHLNEEFSVLDLFAIHIFASGAINSEMDLDQQMNEAYNLAARMMKARSDYKSRRSAEHRRLMDRLNPKK